MYDQVAYVFLNRFTCQLNTIYTYMTMFLDCCVKIYIKYMLLSPFFLVLSVTALQHKYRTCQCTC